MSILGWALWFVDNGWPVFPAHGIKDGRCTCRLGPECTSPGKHPNTRRGSYDATLDPRQIKAWCARNAHANLALATGGITVLDVDGAEGRRSLEKLLDNDRAAHLRKTPRARTGRVGGWHLFFQGVDVKNWVKLWPGIDIRSKGGHVILPPSLHITGRRYAFDRCPTQFKIQEFPSWLLKAAQQKKPEAPRVVVTGARDIDLDSIAPISDYRNNTLSSICGTLMAHGHPVDEVTRRLSAVNQQRCQPPLDQREVDKIIWSISRYH